MCQLCSQLGHCVKTYDLKLRLAIVLDDESKGLLQPTRRVLQSQERLVWPLALVSILCGEGNLQGCGGRKVDNGWVGSTCYESGRFLVS